MMTLSKPSQHSRVTMHDESKEAPSFFWLTGASILATGVLSGVFVALWCTPLSVTPDRVPVMMSSQANASSMPNMVESTSPSLKHKVSFSSDALKRPAPIVGVKQESPVGTMLLALHTHWKTLETQVSQPLGFLKKHEVTTENTSNPLTPMDALQALRSAAQAGDAQAAYQLALAYEDGALGLRRNPFEAMHWLKTSALAGYPEAMYAYAVRLQRRAFNSKDLLNSYVWLKLASDSGYTKATTLLELTWNMLEYEQRLQVPGVMTELKDTMLKAQTHTYKHTVPVNQH